MPLAASRSPTLRAPSAPDAESGGQLAAALAALLPPAVVVEEHAFAAAADPGPATDDELASLGDCVASRRREFVVGRACARRALRRLGRPAASIPIGPDRGPCWPAGVVGSISHDITRCVAVVAEASGFDAIGVDVERDLALDVALDAGLWRPVLTSAEQAQLGPTARRIGIPAAALATVAFSAKESFYKAQAPLTRTMLDFLDVEVQLDDGAFRVLLLRDVDARFVAGSTWSGVFLRGSGTVCTAMWIPAHAAARAATGAHGAVR